MKYSKGNNLRVNLIEIYMRTNNMTKAEFCEKSKISEEVLDKMFALDYDFETVELFKLAKTLKLYVYQLFE